MRRPLPQPDRPNRSLFPAALGLVVAAGVVGGLVFEATAHAQSRRPTRLQPPGPESFAVPPKTPLEQWNAVDYLVRSGQAKLAVPYLNAFLKAGPDDATLLRVRDEYGLGSILRLRDDPATAPLAEPILKMVGDAARRHATDPEQLERAIDALTLSAAEQEYGVDRLRRAGPYAVPPLVRRIADSKLSDADHALIVRNMGRLDSSAVPALLAVLDAPDAGLAADAAAVLGQIGDARAVAALTYPAARSDAPPALQEAAREAIAQLTGRAFDDQPRTPVRVLADQGWAYLRGEVVFPTEAVELWDWNEGAPEPVTLASEDAASELGLRRAREALQLDPSDVPAQVAAVGLALESAARTHGAGVVASNDPTGAFAAALATGPDVLGEVLRAAIRENHPNLAAVAALALARVADRGGVAGEEQPSPLVEALSAPDRRVQFAAAAALVHLDPPKTFPGASRVVPVLSRFAAMRPEPRAVIIDGNLNRAGGVVAALQALGYDPLTAEGGREGFRLASGSADIEFVVIEPSALQGAWSWRDTIANLRADARTAGLPVFLIGPIKQNQRLAPSVSDDPRTALLVATEDAQALDRLLGRELRRMGHRSFSDEERQGYAQAAASLLARIATKPGSPFAADLPAAEPALSRALNQRNAAPAASVALGDVPGIDAQRSLADVLLDPSRPAELRETAGNQLARSIQRFGPLLTDDQERRLVEQADSEPEAAVRPALAAVLGALRPEPRDVGSRLRDFAPVQPPVPSVEPNAPTSDTKPGS